MGAEKKTVGCPRNTRNTRKAERGTWSARWRGWLGRRFERELKPGGRPAHACGYGLHLRWALRAEGRRLHAWGRCWQRAGRFSRACACPSLGCGPRRLTRGPAARGIGHVLRRRGRARPGCGRAIHSLQSCATRCAIARCSEADGRYRAAVAHHTAAEDLPQGADAPAPLVV
jgi:hypothetical protein